MRVGRRMIAVLALLLALGSAVRFYMGRAAEDRVAANERVDLRGLRSPLPQNAFLACPPDYCNAAEAAASPVFAVPWQRLARYWDTAITGEPRIVRLAAEPGSARRVLIQRSAVFRFPDIVVVEFVALGSEQSSLAIYSRARYGKLDFGVNRRRVERWLALLRQAAGG
jgi:hypothetical protein